MHTEPYRNLRIVFMGTPEFAVASLAALYEGGCQIAGVVTAPDKPAGRGMQLQQSAVKKYSVEKGFTVLQPEKLKNPEFLQQLKALNADLFVVVAFRMLPELVWNMPRLGTINLHGSLLPQYRGAAPINWAVINGEPQTGVTTFKLKHEIDTGDILLQEAFPIADDETAGAVHDRMMHIGAALLLKTVKGLADGSITEQPQNSVTGAAVLKHAPKIFTETCCINWNKTVQEIYNLIRGLSPYPAAFTIMLNGKTLKIYRAEKEMTTPAGELGQHFTDGKHYLKFAAADGYISVTELQLEGKKRMKVDEFLRGWRNS